MMGASSQHDPYDVAKADYFPKAQAQILLQKAEEDAVTQLAALAGQVVLIQDTPLLPENPLDCLRTHGSDSVTECQWQQDMARQGFPWSRAHLGETWAVLDMNDLICPKGLCSEIQGDMITYRDTHHLTNSFVLSLRDHFDQRLSALLHL